MYWYLNASWEHATAISGTMNNKGEKHKQFHDTVTAGPEPRGESVDGTRACRLFVRSCPGSGKYILYGPGAPALSEAFDLRGAWVGSTSDY